MALPASALPDQKPRPNRQLSTPLLLAVLSILAYGLLLPQMGFYWDDWPWIWLSHVQGPSGLLQIDISFRPLTGVFLWLVSLLAGKSALGWQMLNLFLRWLSAWALWWSLRKVWPQHAGRITWLAVIFLLYPGFQQQFVAVNNSRHIFPLAIYFISLGFMLWAIRTPQRAWQYSAIALLLTAISMLTTEYFYGLELVKPVIICLVMAEVHPGRSARLAATLRYSLPMLLLQAAIFAWRYVVPHGNYTITLMADITRQPVTALLEMARRAGQDLLIAALRVWGLVFEFPARSVYGLKGLALTWGVAAASALLVASHVIRASRQAANTGFWKIAIGLGIFALLIADLPFLATDVWVGINFPADRTTLPLMFGACLIAAGILDALSRWKPLPVLLLAAMAGLSTGMHYRTALSYQKDWQIQESFFRQLARRIPGLQPGTALVYEYTTALQELHITDNSLTAPLNWLYAPDFSGAGMPYRIYDLRTRTTHRLPPLTAGQPIADRYGGFEFSGSTSALLALHFAPPACLQLLRPELAGLYPHLPATLASAVPLSNPALIHAAPGEPARFLDEIFGPDTAGDWCYDFQQADLARQVGDWQTVTEIWETAAQRASFTVQPLERLPFIEGFARQGNWQSAGDLTLASLQQDGELQPALCFIWNDLHENSSASAEKERTARSILAELNCQEQ